MLTPIVSALVIALALAIALFGWVSAWRSRGEALVSADLRMASESQLFAVRLGESISNNALADAKDQLVMERERSAWLRLQLAKANADLEAMRRLAEDLAPTSEDVSDSVTSRLRRSDELVRRPSA